MLHMPVIPRSPLHYPLLGFAMLKMRSLIPNSLLYSVHIVNFVYLGTKMVISGNTQPVLGGPLKASRKSAGVVVNIHSSIYTVPLLIQFIYQCQLIQQF